MERNASLASAILLVIAGVWLLLQTLVGDLPGRIVSWKPAPTSKSGMGGAFTGGGTGTSAGGGGGSAGSH